LVRVAAALASRDEQILRTALVDTADSAEPAAVEEVLLQSYLFLGFPAAIWGLGIWRSVQVEKPITAESRPDSSSSDNGEPAEDREVEEDREPAHDWKRTGEELCARVYGDNYEKLRRNVRTLHPELDSWMILEGYGKVLSRSVLDLVTRELCIVAALGVTRWEAQLHSHLRGALNVGSEPAEIEAALETGLRLTEDDEWRSRARVLWERVLERHVR
jgi:4-carboxymuconolactone decarboxylase